MKKYMNLLKKYDKKSKMNELLYFKESIYCDEILLETDIYYNEYNDDVIISDERGFCEDLYIDDTLYYID